MGKCAYCGKDAGFMRKKHKACHVKHYEGIEQMIAAIRKSVTEGSELHSLEKHLKEVAADCLVSDATLSQVIVKVWENVVDKAREEGFITVEEESNLLKLGNHFSLTQEDLDQNGAYSKLRKLAVLRDTSKGKIPDRTNGAVSLPFNLQKKESLVWLFRDVEYYEETATKEGHVDTGLLGITDKHIYFAGSQKTFRTSYNKILAFTEYGSGIGMQRDGAKTKKQFFKTGDGWFTYNLVINVSKL